MKKIIVLSILYTFFSCTNSKKIDVYGYAYSNDSIFIFEDEKEILKIRVNGNEDAKKLCPVNESDLKIKATELKLKIKIDSSSINVLDTVLTVPKGYTMPFVTFVYPSSKTKFKRLLLMGDKSMFPKD